jgi:hypothetical protein
LDGGTRSVSIEYTVESTVVALDQEGPSDRKAEVEVESVDEVRQNSEIKKRLLSALCSQY